MAHIYLITNRVNGKLYVGQTRQTPEIRWRQHKIAAASCRLGCRALNRAIRKHGAESFAFKIIEECDLGIANAREIYWIKDLGTIVPNGYNLTHGGDVGTEFSQETREKISAANRARSAEIAERNRSPSARAKISAANQNRTPEERAVISAKISASHKLRKPMSDETRAKIRESLRKFWSENYIVACAANNSKRTDETRVKLIYAAKNRSAETRAKISAAKKNPSDEIRAKIREARKRQTISAETRAKMSAAKTGKVMSAGMRTKMSAIKKAYYAERRPLAV